MGASNGGPCLDFRLLLSCLDRPALRSAGRHGWHVTRFYHFINNTEPSRGPGQNHVPWGPEWTHRCCRAAAACSGSRCWSSRRCTPVTQTQRVTAVKVRSSVLTITPVPVKHLQTCRHKLQTRKSHIKNLTSFSQSLITKIYTINYFLSIDNYLPDINSH